MEVPPPNPEGPETPEPQPPAPVPVTLPCEVRAGACSEFIGTGQGDIWVNGRNLPPSRYAGKTLCIKPGNYGYLALHGVVATQSQPAIVTNCGGQAVFTSTSGSPVSVGGGSRFLRLTGTGSADHVYGLVAGRSGGNQAHVDLRDGTSDVELDHIEVRGDGKGGVGIAFRTYPTCSGTWRRGTWTQNNTRIHDTWVHDTRYEGMYIGPSHHGWKAGNGYTPGFDCGGGVRVEEADVLGVEVVDNVLENIGNDGIQVGGALAGMSVRRNRVRDYGLNNDANHSGGITVNPGSGGVIDGNWIETARPNSTSGIVFQGLGGSLVSNNVIVGARTGTYFLRNTDVNVDRAETDILFHHNTVVASTVEGAYFFCNLLGDVRFTNNIIAGAPTTHAANGNDLSCFKSPAPYNLLSTQVSAAGFVDAAARDFHLLPSSPAVDVGVALGGVVDFDHAGASRAGGPYDLGAFVASKTPVTGGSLRP